MTPTEASPRLSSSMASAYETLSSPAPPHCSGTATPSSDSSASFFTTSWGKRCSSSRFRAWGMSSRAANSRVRRWVSRCRSVSSKSIGILAAGEDRRPLLEEGLHPLASVCGGEEVGEQLTFDGEAVGELEVGSAVDGLLGQADGERSLLRDPLQRGARVAQETPERHHVQDQADLLRLGGVDDVPGEDELLRPGTPEQAGQPLGPAEAGEDAQAHLRETKARILRGVDEVTGKGQLAPAAEREAIDRGHHRHRERSDDVHHSLTERTKVACLVGVHAVHLGDVRTRDEGLLAGAG